MTHGILVAICRHFWLQGSAVRPTHRQLLLLPLALWKEGHAPLLFSPDPTYPLAPSPPLTQFFLECGGLVRTDKKPALCKSYQKLVSEVWHRKR